MSTGNHNVSEADVVTSGEISIAASSMTWRFFRATGPGGQGVNTTDSRVELCVDLTALAAAGDLVDRVRSVLGDSIRIVAATERSQLRNREAALRRPVDRLDSTASRYRPRTPTRPTRGSVRARPESKSQQARLKAGRRDPGEETD
jgi:ribosome-associated protein